MNELDTGDDAEQPVSKSAVSTRPTAARLRIGRGYSGRLQRDVKGVSKVPASNGALLPGKAGYIGGVFTKSVQSRMAESMRPSAIGREEWS